MCSKLLHCNGLNIEAPVAQLDRASVYGTEGWGFEPSQACSKNAVFPSRALCTSLLDSQIKE